MFLEKIINKRKDVEKSFSKLNDGAIHWVPIESIHFNEVFKSTYDQKAAKLKLLESSLKENGFDPLYPIIVTENADIVEGNSRAIAAANVGIEKVAILVKKFESEEAGVKWQRDRQGASRQLDDAEVFEQFIYYENLKKKNELSNDDCSGFTNQNLAEACNVSPRLISTFRFIYENTTEEELKEYLNALKDKKTTFNKIEKEIKRKQNPEESSNSSATQKLTSADIFRLGFKFAMKKVAKFDDLDTTVEKLGIDKKIEFGVLEFSPAEEAFIEKIMK